MGAQSGNSWQIVFTPQAENNFLLEEFIENFFTASTCDYNEDGKILYTGYLADKSQEEDMKKAAVAWGLKLPDYKCEFIPAANWLTKNVIKFPPLETQDFYIYGTHEEQIPDNTKHKLRIYAATAFGSGQHQTTRLCLELLSQLYHQGFSPNNILDMGCGSGILALSALKLWTNATAVAADIDNEAVIVSLQNAADNDLQQRLLAAAGDGYNNDTVIKHAPYQLIFSNILARPLTEMAPHLSSCLNIGGYTILSGFINEQSEWVLDAHRKQGLQLVKIIENENWRAALMEKIK